MKLQLADPSYRATTDLTFHRYAISEAVHNLYPHATLNTTRYYFELMQLSSEEAFNLVQLNNEISSRDAYLNQLYVPYPLKTQSGETSVKPLLFTLITH